MSKSLQEQYADYGILTGIPMDDKTPTFDAIPVFPAHLWPVKTEVVMPEAWGPVRLGVRRFRPEATLPSRGTSKAAGFDLYAYCREETPTDSLLYISMRDDADMGWIDGSGPGLCSYKTTLAIPPGRTLIVPTGINLRIPAGYEVQIRPRSGLAAKSNVTVLNAPGTIDEDYSGDGEAFEIKVILINHGTREFVITHGMRIAQMTLHLLPRVELYEAFEDAARDGHDRIGGLGSTGTGAVPRV